jgi:tetratricopeptide (TPR) repeat protein
MTKDRLLGSRNPLDVGPLAATCTICVLTWDDCASILPAIIHSDRGEELKLANAMASDIALVSRLRSGLALLLFLALLLPGITSAQAPAGAVVRAVSVQGVVEARRTGQTSWQPVRLNDTFSPGDTIRVGPRGRADIALLDQSVLRLNANTELTVEPVKDERTGVVNLLRGAAHFFSRGPRSLEVQTPFTVAGVRGTEFYIGLEPNQALLTVFEGTVVAQNPSGSLTLTSGQSAVAETGKAPVLRVVARPRDAVQWTLHYPPVLYFRPDEFPAGSDWQGLVRRSNELYVKGDVAGAFDALSTAPATVPDGRFYAYRAHLLLTVGRVDEAAADIEQALRLAPNDANALSLQTIIAVAQGDKDRAFATAQRAVAAAPKSATAQIALSYAQQARFDLEGARKSVENAVALDDKNALAWARLSELWASFGELDRAQRAAQRAVALEPNLSRTQTVLGYAYLMRVKTKDAKAAFEKAIVADQGDPLPRLGLGLAKIREGQLKDGGREIEAAASLDPSNALVRSYLGKTYYEEKRKGLDEREYQMAKQLDPNDPTAPFYDAIAKQTTNRPVEALHEMQQSIELNDNRAVYRSRLLLDADEAARSASQGRIYSDLGFQQLALVEGWKSVNTDPANYSAHRLLADSYAIQPRHEIARVSELLQSQLLQPINTTPIQPRLAESNLFLISGGGPGGLSFNEFNPIFNRNGVTLQATGLVGNNSTYAGEGVIAGIYQNVSFSVGHSHFSTNGWRTNADEKDDITNAFVQVELTPSTSIQAEYRRRRLEHGDLIQRFFKDDFFPGERNTEDRDTYRIGARHAFSPNSILLASVMYSDVEFTLKDDQTAFPITSVSFRRPESALSAELQHLFRSRYVNVTSGVGYFDVSGRVDQVTGLDPAFAALVGLPPELRGHTGTDLKHVNGYAYATISPLRSLSFTAGLSVDSIDGESPDVGETTQINPKAGVIWEPFKGTTLRAAAFRVVKRTLITDQTLEPTQVAGFNQFFDDENGTKGWRYGGAIDQRFTKDLFAGVEVSKREGEFKAVDIITDPNNPSTSTFNTGELVMRGYVFWTPHPWVALRAEYMNERFTKDIPDDRFELTTHRVPLGVSFFHPLGISTTVTATYWNQYGRFNRFSGAVEAGDDQFWTVDAAIGYRLPRRYGFITFGVANLFDQDFKFFDRDAQNPTIQPTRTIFGKVTLAFP